MTSHVLLLNIHSGLLRGLPLLLHRTKNRHRARRVSKSVEVSQQTLERTRLYIVHTKQRSPVEAVPPLEPPADGGGDATAEEIPTWLAPAWSNTSACFKVSVYHCFAASFHSRKVVGSCCCCCPFFLFSLMHGANEVHTNRAHSALPLSILRCDRQRKSKVGLRAVPGSNRS
jgi:hypothetical protein